MKKILTTIFGTAVLFIFLPCFATEYALEVLPHLDATPGYYTRPTGINNSGDVTGFEFQNSHRVKAFLVKNGQIQDLSTLVPEADQDTYANRVSERDAQGLVQVLGKNYNMDGVIRENDYFLPIWTCVSYPAEIVRLSSGTFVAGTVDNTDGGSRPAVWDESANLYFLGPDGQQGTVWTATASQGGNLLILGGGTRTMPGGGSLPGQPFLALFNPSTHTSSIRLLPMPAGALDAWVTNVLPNGAAFAVAKMASGDERPYFYSRQGQLITLPFFSEHRTYQITGAAIVGNEMIAVGHGRALPSLYYLDRAIRWKVSLSATGTPQTEIRKIRDLLSPAVASQWENYYFFVQDINAHGDIVGYGRPLPITGWWEQPVLLRPASGE